MIMGEQHRDNSSALPIIDLGQFTDSDPNGRLKVSQRLVQVCHDVGFCYISNHGLPQSDIDKAFHWTRKFYDLPRAVLESVRRPEDSTSFLGWHGIGKLTAHEGGIDTTEQFNYGSDADPHEQSRWPDDAEIPGFHAWAQHFYDQCWFVSEKVLRALALGLGIDEEFLLKIHDPRGSQVVLKHYPPVPIADIEGGTVRRLSAHTDFSSMTILLQEEQGGLEIESGGKFIYVDQVPGAFVLNIGDISQVWSNNYLKSTLHRVGVPHYKQAGEQSSTNGETRRMTRQRYSIPVFTKPKWDAVLEPMPGYEGGSWKKQTFLEFYKGKAAEVLNNNKPSTEQAESTTA